MINYPSVETLQKQRRFSQKMRLNRLAREKKEHKQNCYKAQKIKLQLQKILEGRD